MNKLTALALAMTTALSSWAVPADYQWPTEMITEQPDGECSQTYVSSQITWLLYNNQTPATINGNYGVERHMVVNGNDVYLESFLLEKNTGSWIHGTVQENGDVVFAFPQKIYQDAHYEWFLGTLTPTVGDGGVINMELIPENCNMTMRWIDGVLTQVLPSTEGIDNEQVARLTGMVGAVNQSGNYLAYGEKGVSVRTWTEQPLEAPEFTSTEAFEFAYIDRDNAEVHTQMTLGFTSDEVWIQGLNRWLPEAWIKGTITATGWEFDVPQYMGTYIGFYTFAMGATGNISEGFTAKDKITFTKNGESYLSSDVLCVNISTEKLDPSLVFSDMEFTPMSSVVQVPPAPDGFELEWDDNDQMGVVYFVLPVTDIEGRPLDMRKLYYNVYFNGELHTFTPEDDFVDETMTDVPAQYTNNFTIMQTGDGGVILVVLTPYETVGVRCVYKNASETTYSDIVTHTLNSGLTLETVSAPVLSETYFSTQGRPVAMPTPGNIYIVRRVFSDGKVKVAKITL